MFGSKLLQKESIPPALSFASSRSTALPYVISRGYGLVSYLPDLVDFSRLLATFGPTITSKLCMKLTLVPCRLVATLVAEELGLKTSQKKCETL